MEAFNSFFYTLVWPWVLSSGLRIVLIVIGALVLGRFSKVFVDRAIRRVIAPDHFLSPEAEKKREDTLIKVTSGTLGVVISLVAFLMILQEFGIAIAPILAAAGVAGIAFGFGGQYLIRDVITGLFLILENQYRVGDVVSFDGTAGLVEDITLRMTTLRDLDGTVHHVPHGEVKKVSNLTKYYSRVNLNIGVGYDSDLEHVKGVVNEVGQALADDPEWKDAIIKPPQFLRVNDFGDSAIVLKILGETKPIRQWEVAGELRWRLKLAFDKEGIEIPFPQRVFWQGRDDSFDKTEDKPV